MQKSTVSIIWGLLFIGCISMFYFISLLAHIPIVVTSALILIAGILLYRWLNKSIPVVYVPVYSTRKQITQYAVFIIGISLITYKACGFAEKYGGWDAWCLWNTHAKYLADSHNWKAIYNNPALRYKHPDYPLYISNTIAFFWRLIGVQSAFIPFSISFLGTLLIPVLIYLNLYNKNFLIATLIILLFAFDNYYLKQGVQQYSDTPLALLFLSTIICFDYYKTSKSVVFIILAAALAGCCMWTKNEGVMLVLFWIIFNIRDLFAGGRWKYFLAGICLPALVLLLFKSITPANDLVANTDSVYKLLFDPTRYQLIKKHLIDNLNQNFFYAAVGTLVYAIVCIIERKLDRNFSLLLCCTAGYLLVYVLTPLELDWQLNTSMDRVLHQIMPTFIYVVGLRLCKTKWILGYQQL